MKNVDKFYTHIKYSLAIWVHFMAFWYILWPFWYILCPPISYILWQFGVVYGHLV
jgi:hypothetical protein